MNPSDPLYPWIFIYGPPASGKTSLGKRLARQLALPFYDLDSIIQGQTGMDIPAIFSEHGEASFRRLENQALLTLVQGSTGVVSLGGGALLHENTRQLVEERGIVLCLNASPETLLKRLQSAPPDRPLLAGDPAERLPRLLQERADHYASFPRQLCTDHLSLSQAAWEAQISLGRFYLRGMGRGYPVIVQRGALAHVATLFQRMELRAPAAIISDATVGRLFTPEVKANLADAGYPTIHSHFPVGEGSKNLTTLQEIWQAFLSGGVERISTVLALGGGVTTDLAGFAASVYLRGVPWAALPTSLLAMVDASLGGKTAIDLPQGKNLVGAFYPPRFVLVDPDTLDSLPEKEIRNGLSEIVKAGVIADPQLFRLCAAGWQRVQNNMELLIKRAIAVKVRYVQSDPYERGRRAALNFGHTIGHAVEQVSQYRLSHGQAVSIGMVIETLLSEQNGLARRGLATKIASVLADLGLPTAIPPELDRIAILSAMQMDKKRRGKAIHFALPERIGKVCTGVALQEVFI